MKWQPIETAPTNTNVLMYCPNRGVTNEERIEFGWAISTTGNRNTWATHWMPLPNESHHDQ